MRPDLFVAMAAYGAYAINASQFLMKLRSARLQAGPARGRVAAAGIIG